MEPPWDGETKDPGHMTKMAAMPIYGKNLKNFLLNPKADDLETWYAALGARVLYCTKTVQMMILGWPWLILRQGQIWSLMLLYGKNVKQRIFQKLL